MTNESKIVGINDDQLKKIGLALKQLRIDKNYKSYDHLAYELKMSRSHYGKYERGQNMTLNSLFRILDFHGITFLQFIEEYLKPISNK
jgi:transcriptional regulator with XRE-family HTH domain